MAAEDTIIVGGGISGLLAAKAALESGEKNITVYEASKRFGGKLISGNVDGKLVNMGAEFVDEENIKIRKLAEELGSFEFRVGNLYAALNATTVDEEMKRSLLKAISANKSGIDLPNNLLTNKEVLQDFIVRQHGNNADPVQAFLDSFQTQLPDNHPLKTLKKQELGVRLIPTGDQSKEIFQSPSGKMMPNFIKDYAPIAEAIGRIRDEMENNPDLAQRMQSLSAKALMEELGKKVPVDKNQGMFKRIGNFFYDLAMVVTFQSSRANRVSQEVRDTALAAMEKEQGAKSENITAAQFMSETSPSTDRFLASTCDYRVEGGTETIAVMLKKHLEAKGVKFEAEHKLEELQKSGNDKILSFATANGTKKIQAKNVVVALPAYSLPKIKGLEFLGLEDSPVQYTKNAKITVKIKPGVNLPSEGANAFLSGSECWSPNSGLLTFLVENTKGEAPAAVMKKTLDNYAQAFGKRAEDLFYIEGGKPLAGTFAYTNPGDAPCWSTPSPQNSKKNETLFAKMEALADQGLAFVGTYIPLPDGGVGFMECGAESVDRIVRGRMFGQGHAQQQEVALAHDLPDHTRSFAARARTEQTGSKQLGV